MIALAALYALATAVLVIQGLRLLSLAVGRMATQPTPEAQAPGPPEAWPRVCVQLPVYNEPEVVERVVAAAAALDYPAMEIQVLDDSTDATTERARRAVARAQASGVRAELVRRDGREGFKAGALANGLARTDAPLVAVFDADFVPAPDTLRRLVAPLVADPALAFAQGRWGHINRDDSVLTRAQGALLDLHFSVEQVGRQRLGRFVPFNGTAGVWRREVIARAGGWSGRTLAEDLDLSLRAWAGGARGHVVEPLAVPAELPTDLSAWRRQQARWAEGMTGVTRLHARRLLGARQRLGARLWALLAISAPLAYPALLAMVLLHPVLAVLQATGRGPSEAFFAALGVGWLGLAGAVMAQAVGQRATRDERPPHARGRTPADRNSAGLWRLAADAALGLAAPLALALVGTRAVARGLALRRGTFERTPKGGLRERAARGWGDAALAAYAIAGAVALATVGAWLAFVFQAVFAATLGAVAWAPTRRQRRPRLDAVAAGG